MAEFYLCPVDDIDNQKYDFYLLYIDGRNFFEDFVKSLRQKSELDEMDTIMALMDKVDNNNLPTSKYRHITGGKYDRKDVWEFKSKHLRIYTLYNTAAKSNRFGTQDKPNKNVIRTWATTQEKSIQRISRPK